VFAIYVSTLMPPWAALSATSVHAAPVFGSVGNKLVAQANDVPGAKDETLPGLSVRFDFVLSETVFAPASLLAILAFTAVA
jgi:hypothetical protein